MKHANISFFVPMAGCPNKCIFCDQNPITGNNNIPTKETVIATLERAKEECKPRKEETEIAFFGGSFTMLPRPLMEELLTPAAEYVNAGHFKGIRISTRPDAIDSSILSFLKEKRVTSIELGAQSSDDKVLKMNGRGHGFADTVRASALIKEAGFSLGLQMMTGLYGANDESDLKSGADFATLHPDTIRIYPTLVLKGTKLATLYNEGKYIPKSVKEASILVGKLMEIFQNEGIKIIKVGLHSEMDLEGALVAGPFHPAFRELCQSAMIRDKVDFLLENASKGEYLLYLPQKLISSAVGQHRENIIHWKEKGYIIKVEKGEELKITPATKFD